jgi:hypothetical protein
VIAESLSASPGCGCRTKVVKSTEISPLEKRSMTPQQSVSYCEVQDVIVFENLARLINKFSERNGTHRFYTLCPIGQLDSSEIDPMLSQLDPIKCYITSHVHQIILSGT